MRIFYKPMWLKLVLSLMIILFLPARSLYSGNTYVSMIPDIEQIEVQEKAKFGSMPLKSAFIEIRKLTGCSFLYNNNLIDETIIVDLKPGDDIESILNSMLGHTSIAYKIVDNQVILYPQDMVNDESTIKNKELAGANASKQVLQKEDKRRITGKVISSDDKLPLIGVSIVPDNMPSKGVSTDLDGNFSITLDNGVKHLSFSYISFQTLVVPVGNRAVINVELFQESIALNEAVVSTGYMNEKKKNLSGAVSNVSSKDLRMANVDNVQRALEGKAAGVQIVSASGLPGASVNINIRGKSSINASLTPLYIIDGVQVSTGDYSKIVQTSSVISGLNPEDIESIDILKDAATASIYGAQAANGVIIIKTKRGSQGIPKISFSANYGLDMVSDNLKVMNSEQFIELSLMGIYNLYGNSSSNFKTPFNTYKDRGWISSDISDFPNLTLNSSAIPNDDWKKAIFRKGLSQEYQLNVAAGNETIKAYVSGSYNNSDASTIFNYFKRASLRSNVDIKINRWLDISNSTTFGNTKQRQPVSGGLIATPVRGVLMMIPYNRIYNEDGTLNVDDLEGAQTTNPIQASELNDYVLATNKLIHSTEFIFKVLPGLEFKASGKIDYNNLSEQQYLDPNTPQGRAYEGFIATANTELLSIQTSETVNYRTVSANGKHRFNLLGGFEYNKYENTGSKISAVGVPTSDFKLLSQAGAIDGFSQTYTGYKMIGLFARLGYTFNDKYIFNFVIRRDGSSRFGDNQKWGTFPAVSAAWRVIDEPFIKDNISWMNDLKIKASYGHTGNSSIGNFVSRPQFAGSGRYDNIPGISPSIPGNKDLTWETKKSLNLGIDLSIFNERVNIQADYFNDITEDLLFERPVPINSGYTYIPQNVGSVRNRGFELSLNITPIKLGDFTWNISPNFTWLKNEILSLTDGVSQIGNTLVVGKPIDVFYTYPFAGVNPADGRPMWYNKDGYVTYTTSSEDRVYLNGIYPTFFGGVINSFTWKGFDLSFLFQYQSGARRYNSDKVQLSRVGNTNDRNQRLEMYTKYWKEPGQITDVAQPMSGNSYLGPGGKTTSYSAASSQHYDKTDFIKLKNISLAYAFPKKIAGKLGMNTLSMAVNAYNLWTTTTYTGYDPEFTGSDSGTYPQSRTVTFVLKFEL